MIFGHNIEIFSVAEDRCLVIRSSFQFYEIFSWTLPIANAVRPEEKQSLLRRRRHCLVQMERFLEDLADDFQFVKRRLHSRGQEISAEHCIVLYF